MIQVPGQVGGAAQGADGMAKLKPAHLWAGPDFPRPHPFIRQEEGQAFCKIPSVLFNAVPTAASDSQARGRETAQKSQRRDIGAD